ncbi:hypothetical protein VSH64_24840 [Amycolatopsis rhabdoformis]|uniref:Uncharacterized protein n=1 Tax=Amycolatopsis rhabdoformis TaxID=1448059 RepID=A0ABZ1HVK1_9PSEU|nr:hypothetical protein [Amycolatopsis rhabdoformis]WSE26105.1 hypothetical protein VSH64_24840 [Amycolatopsis rhabdoformis]
MADRSVSVKLLADVAQYIAKMQAAGKSTRDLESAGRDLRKALDDEADAEGRVRVASEKLNEVRNNGKASVAQLAAAEEDHASSLRKLEAAQLRTKDATDKFAAAQKQAASDTEESNRRVEQSFSRVSARANAAFDIKSFSALSVGLPAAAAVGAAGVTAALGIAATGFAALGVYAASSDVRIAQAFTDLKNSVQRDAAGMGAALRDDVMAAIDDASKAWDRLKPQVQAAVNASAPAIRTLTGAVTDFAEGAMPGLLTAVEKAGPELEGIRDFAGAAGTGLGQFFTNASSGSQDAGKGFELLGNTVQLLEARLGTLFAHLAQGSSGPLNSLYAIVDQITGALNAMTAQGSGVIGALNGFTLAGTGAVATMTTLLRLISALPPEITNFAGAFGAASLIASKFGLDVGKGFEGLGKKISEAKGVTSKFSTAIGGLVEGAFNPTTFAVSALGIGLDILGKKQQEAAANAAAHAERERNLADALRESGGAVDANVRAQAAYDLGNFKVGDSVRNLNKEVLTLAGPQGLKQLQDAYLGNSQAGDTLKASLTSVLDQHRKVATGFQAAKAIFDDHINYVDGVAYAYDDTGLSAQTLLDALGSEGGIFNEASQGAAANAQAVASAGDSYKALTPAEIAAKTAAVQLTGAFGNLTGAGGDVAQAGADIISALRILAGQTPSVDEAMQAWNDTIRGLKDNLKDLNLGKQSKDFIDASGAINTTTEAGSKLQDTVTGAANQFAAYGQALRDAGKPSDEIATKLDGMRDSFAKQLKQMGLNDKQIGVLLDHYGLIPDKINTVLGIEGNDAAKQEIEKISSDLKGIPAEKGINIKTISAPAQKALEDLGYKIVALPDGTFQVFADTKAGQHAADVLLNNINQTKGTVSIYGDADPATGAVADWKTETSHVYGNTTVTSDISPANGAVRTWVSTTDATGAVTTTFTTTDPATGKVQQWKRNTDGTWAQVNVDANTQAARDAVNGFVRDNNGRVVSINVVTYYKSVGTPGVRTGISSPDSYYVGPHAADGGLFTDGGLRRFADGGLNRPLDVSGGGQLYGPGTGRSDSIIARVANGEYVMDAANTRRNLSTLVAMSNGKTPMLQQQILSGAASVQQWSPRVVVQAPASTAGRGGQGQANVTINTAQTDPNRLAAAMVSALAWQLR